MNQHISGPRDVNVDSRRSTYRGVCTSAAEPRPWLRGFGVNDTLARHCILHVGVATAFAPMRVVRTWQTTTYFFACFGGRGKVFVDGRWRLCGPGMACLLPPHTFEAFHSVGRQPWQFCWVCYGTERVVASVVSPVLAPFRAEPLRHAIEGLRQENLGGAPVGVDRWVDLIEDYVRRFAEPWRGDERMVRLWEKVVARLAEPWPLDRLAREVHCSGELLRRRCHVQLGRSPGQHLIHLRMRRAAELLVTTSEKVESIAAAVGYQNPFVFSTTFKKRQGCTPTEYRGQRSVRRRPDPEPRRR